MDLGEREDGLLDPKYQSIAGFSQSGTRAATLASWKAQGRSKAGFRAGRPGQLGQRKWHYRHSSESSHQLQNKVITGLGIKLVTCVIISLRTRTERTFLKSCSLAPPKSIAAETQMSDQPHTQTHTHVAVMVLFGQGCWASCASQQAHTYQ